jgi:hypothetical protein
MGGFIAAESRSGSEAGVEGGLAFGDAEGVGERAETSLAGASVATERDATSGLACCTTAAERGTAGPPSAWLAPGVTIVVIGRGSTTSGAGWAGIAIGGAGVVNNVVSGRAEPGLAATRTLSPSGDVANTAVTTRASSIIAVGQQRKEVVLWAKTAVPARVSEAVTIECGAGLDAVLRPASLTHQRSKIQTRAAVTIAISFHAGDTYDPGGAGRGLPG